MVNIIENIELVRKQKGIKQEVIAKILGVTQPAYSNYVTRNSDIYFNRLSQIADALSVSVIDIITHPKKYIDSESIIENSGTTRVVVEFDVSKDEFIKMGLKDKVIQVLNK